MSNRKAPREFDRLGLQHGDRRKDIGRKNPRERHGTGYRDPVEVPRGDKRGKIITNITGLRLYSCDIVDIFVIFSFGVVIT